MRLPAVAQVVDGLHDSNFTVHLVLPHNSGLPGNGYGAIRSVPQPSRRISVEGVESAHECLLIEPLAIDHPVHLDLDGLFGLADRHGDAVYGADLPESGLGTS